MTNQTRPIFAKKKEANAVLMAESKTSKAFLDSKFTVNAVIEFQVEYQNTRNNESFFENICNRLAQKIVN